MYNTKRYLTQDSNYILDFINAHPFATFIINGDRMLATHIPVLTEGNAEKFTLFGHIADTNEQYPFLKDGLEALLVFQGANAYISSSWYKEKDISTWDYSAVHINVRIKIQTPEELEESLQKLVAHFEKDQEKPLFYEEIPQKMIQDHLPRITGFTCQPERIDAIAKLHQGSDRDDIKKVIDHLDSQDDPHAAKLREDIKKMHDL